MQLNEKSVAETTAPSNVDDDHGAIESLSHTKQTYTMKLGINPRLYLHDPVPGPHQQ